jgi:hypothetical protein
MFNAGKKCKSYTFFDVIGIKETLLNGTAIDILDKVWKAVDEWLTHKSSIKVTLKDNQGTSTCSKVKVFVVSDSIFLRTEKEYDLESFYTIVDSLREYLKKRK